MTSACPLSPVDTSACPLQPAYWTKVGEGGFGTVFRSSVHFGIVAKVFRFKDGDAAYNESVIRKAMRESTHMVLAGSNGAVPHCHCIFPGLPPSSPPYIIMDYAGEDLLGRCGCFSDSEVALLLYQLWDGMTHIHSKGVAHLDLKPENLLLDCQRLRISDFGLSVSIPKTRQPTLTDMCGSYSYAAPEVWTPSQPYNGFEADVWSMGVLTFAILVGRLPFETSRQGTCKMYALFKTRTCEEGMSPSAALQSMLPFRTHAIAEAYMNASLHPTPSRRTLLFSELE